MRVQARVRLLPASILLVLLSGCAPPPLKHAVLAVTPNESVADDPPRRKWEPRPDAIHYAPREEFVAALKFLEALTELEKIRRAHPERYEATFNEAILIHEYGNLVRVDNYEIFLVAAIRLYREFIQQAEGDPDAADAVRIAKERLAEIDHFTVCIFNTDTEADRKRLEQEAKQRAAEAEVNRQE